MNHRWALPWNSHVHAIKHGLVCRHIVIDNLKYDAELTDDDLPCILLAPKEG